MGWPWRCTRRGYDWGHSWLPTTWMPQKAIKNDYDLKLLLLAGPLENLRRYIITSTPTDLKSLRLREHKSERHLWVVSNWIFLDSAYTDVQFSSSPSDAPRRIRSQYTLQIGWQKSLRWLKAESESTPNSMGAVAYRAKVPTGGVIWNVALYIRRNFF